MKSDKEFQTTLELLQKNFAGLLEDVEFFVESKWQDSQEILDGSSSEADQDTKNSQVRNMQ